jgi:hypothetical protein
MKQKNSSTRRGRAEFAFVKSVKDLPEGIMSVIYAAIKKVKSGTVAEITEVAVKGGLKDVTGQDPMVQTAVMLGRLRAMKAVKKLGPQRRAE